MATNSTCEHIRSLLSRYLDGELEAEEQRQVSGHLSRCPKCAREFDALRRMVGRMAALKDVAPEKDFAASILEEIEPPRRGFVARLFSPRFAPVMAGLVVLLIVGGVYGPSLLKTDEEPMQLARTSQPQGAIQADMKAPGTRTLESRTRVQAGNSKPAEVNDRLMEGDLIDSLEGAMKERIVGEREGLPQQRGVSISGTARLPEGKLKSWEEEVARAQEDLEPAFESVGLPARDAEGATNAERYGTGFGVIASARNNAPETLEFGAARPASEPADGYGVESPSEVDQYLSRIEADETLTEIQGASPELASAFDLIVASTDPIRSASALLEEFQGLAVAEGRIIDSTAHPFLVVEASVLPESVTRALHLAATRSLPHWSREDVQTALGLTARSNSSATLGDVPRPRQMTQARAATGNRLGSVARSSAANEPVVAPESDAILEERGEEVPSDDTQRLRALGYIGSSSPPPPTPVAQAQIQPVTLRILILPEETTGYGQQPELNLEMQQQLKSLGYID